MKILFAVESDNGLDSRLDNRFGRAAYFLIWDMDDEKVLSIEENQYKNDGHGVGIKAANLVIDHGCGTVIAAQPGPKAAAILAQAGVKVIVDDKGTVKEALEKYRGQI